MATNNEIKPRKLQEIFDAVIDAELYGGEFRQSSYMCNSLAMARAKFIITCAEGKKAKRAIDTYIVSLCGATSDTLKVALRGAGLPSEFSDRLAIYRNWDKRPRCKTFIKSS